MRAGPVHSECLTPPLLHSDEAHTPMNSAPTPPAPGTEAFNDWCTYLDNELTIPVNPPETRAWLWDLFTGNGSMPADMIAPLILDRRLELTNQAVDYFLNAADIDLKAPTPLTLIPHILHPEPLEPAGQVNVYTTEILSLDPLGIFQETAGATQDYLARRHHIVWPLCPDHRIGTHPEPTTEGVAWTCTVGPHTVRTMTAPTTTGTCQ
ncbi:hypothetical protein [Streptomyces sp. NPDC056188]|uniref:hypothetical protein n=1 Tax=Streptomyces sp. NPDC056188 TaxID=3345740 RepID=UPI0035E1AF01